MTDPFKSSEPFDSEQALARLIRECRYALRSRVRRGQGRMYTHERVAFTRAMLLIQDVPANDLRLFAMDIVDLL